eukprot:1181605-Prorocentrum_minimum.AAC.2
MVSCPANCLAQFGTPALLFCYLPFSSYRKRQTYFLYTYVKVGLKPPAPTIVSPRLHNKLCDETNLTAEGSSGSGATLLALRVPSPTPNINMKYHLMNGLFPMPGNPSSVMSNISASSQSVSYLARPPRAAAAPAPVMGASRGGQRESDDHQIGGADEGVRWEGGQMGSDEGRMRAGWGPDEGQMGGAG